MKITKVEPLHVGQFMFARVETESGLVGVGEAGAWGQGVGVRKYFSSKNLSWVISAGTS